LCLGYTLTKSIKLIVKIKLFDIIDVVMFEETWTRGFYMEK